jgi:hypothetical protein
MPGSAPGWVELLFDTLVWAMFVLLSAFTGSELWRKPLRELRLKDVAGLLLWLAFLAWLFFLKDLAEKGFFLDFESMPPRILVAILPALAALLILSLTRGLDGTLARIPPATLVYLQSFRIVVEFVLWQLVSAGVAPEIMSFHGRNFDILVGLSAPVMAYCCFTRRIWPERVALWWNVAGILVLLNTVVHAQLATPSPFRVFHTTPPNTFIAYPPYVLLPAFLVPLAWFFHAMSIRQLLMRRHRTAAA